MKSEVAISLSIAVAALALLAPQFAQAKNMSSSQVPRIAGEHEATLMVPAQVALAKEIDARKTQPGRQFRATLRKDVQLKNGPLLPRGTVLIGTVASDKMQPKGPSRLALRFTKAELKNGKAVPIKATIMGIAPPAYDTYENPNGEDADSWNRRTLQLDQMDALSGVDLHSKIAGRSSGAFVSTKKDDVKLWKGIHMALAIAPMKATKSL